MKHIMEVPVYNAYVPLQVCRGHLQGRGLVWFDISQVSKISFFCLLLISLFLCIYSYDIYYLSIYLYIY